MVSTHDINKPVFIPKRRSEIPRLVRKAFGLLRTQVEEDVLSFLDSPGREGFLRLEQDLLEAFGTMSSHVAGGVMGFLHQNGAGLKKPLPKSAHALLFPSATKAGARHRSASLGALACLWRHPT